MNSTKIKGTYLVQQFIFLLTVMMITTIYMKIHSLCPHSWIRVKTTADQTFYLFLSHKAKFNYNVKKLCPKRQKKILES